MKDQNIYNQVVLEIVKEKENEYFSAADINRIASLVEKYYRQGYESASRFGMNLSTIGLKPEMTEIKSCEIAKGGVIKGYSPMKDNE